MFELLSYKAKERNEGARPQCLIIGNVENSSRSAWKRSVSTWYSYPHRPTSST